MKSLFLLGAAVSALLLAGCASSTPPPRPVARTTSTVIIGDDDYDYYPGYEVYYSRAHNYYYYRDGNAWVRRNDPPRNWVRGSTAVTVHFHDAPDRHHAEIVRQYPRNWRAPDRDHDGHDARHDRDDHDRDKH